LKLFQRTLTLVLFGLTFAIPLLPGAAAQDRLRAVATFSIVGEIVQNVSGYTIELTTLVGPNADTERYEPSPSDVRALLRAQVIFENGLGSEPWLERLYNGSRSTASRVRVSQDVELIQAADGQPDPHVWHDVANVIRMTQTVRDTLVQMDPANEGIYSSNAEAYAARLQALDDWVLERVSTLPENRRKLVTSHETFGYFAKRYGFEIVGVGVQSFFTHSEPSSQQIAGLVRQIQSAGVPAIFAEYVIDPRLMQRVAREARVTLAPQLYTDALGAPRSSGATYIDMMTHNVSTMVSYLKG
jgi:ABC-type Zn uptake system ZnuABC Zn-binding protein ZnuA